MSNKEEFENPGEESLTYKEKRRMKAREKRHKDQMSVTIFGIVIYSIVLIAIVVLAYVGFKSGINKYREKQAIALEAQKQAEKDAKAAEEAKKAEEEAKAAEEALKAEEEAKAAEDEKYQDAVFSIIENVSEPGNAPVNSFVFERKPQNDENSKLMDYEIYTNPETGEIQKITTRENCGDLYEITDYYYSDSKVNYIAQYREDTDVPVDLAGSKIESRFYFNKGKMIRYIYCENDKATEYTADDFKKYSEGTVEQYKYMEDMMLESSKSVFEKAGSLDESVVISGYVMDELGCATPDSARVELLDRNGRVVQEANTNGDGYYYFIVNADDSMEYHLSISAREDMEITSVYGIKALKGTKAISVETVYLAYTVYDEIYPVQIFAKDAEDANTPLSNAEIKLRYGINNRDGETCLSGVLGDAGETMTALRSGNYTMEISKNGYETSYTSIAVKADHTAFVAYSVKDVPDGSYKCVLSYETTPLDLDLKAFDTYGRNMFKSAVDSMGITTAETISLSNLDSGTYTFYVSDYTDIVACDMMTYRLSQSGAKVYVYGADGLMSVIPVPAGHAGAVWRPFEIRNNRILPVNDYYAYIVDDSVFRSK